MTIIGDRGSTIAAISVDFCFQRYSRQGVPYRSWLNMLRIVCLLLGVLCTLPAVAEDWPHWRGPSRNGHTSEMSGWRNGQWPLKKVWQVNVREGSSSPVVAGGRLYTLGWQSGRDRLVCLDAASGEELWTQEYDCPKYGRKALGDQGIYSGPSSTPEFDTATDLLYTLSTDGDLNCWDTQSGGRQVWGVNFYDEYDAPQRPQVGRSGHRDYGYTSSPLVFGDWLICEVGGAAGTLIAFNKRTGQQAWKSQAQDPAGHTGGPVPIMVEGVPCIAVLSFAHLLVVRADTNQAGETVAAFPWITDFANSIASPTVHENSVVFTSAYNNNAIVRLDITLTEAKQVWKQKFASKVCSPVIHDGCVYFSFSRLRCLDFATGEEKWAGGKFGAPGSLIATADDRLIAWANRGDLLLVDTATHSPHEYRELARLGDLFRTDVWPHVVLAGGRIYLKDRDGNLACYAK